MRSWIAPLAVVALCLAPLGCGGSSRAGASTNSKANKVTAYFPRSSNDRDNDGDRNDDDAHDIYYGHAASAADRSEIATLVRRYYAAAARGDGAEGCSLLVPFFAQLVVEKYGQSPAVSGKTCSVVMSKLFKNHHADVAVKDATLMIPDIRVQEDKALVMLEFPTLREVRLFRVRRAGRGWGAMQLIDTIME